MQTQNRLPSSSWIESHFNSWNGAMAYAVIMSSRTQAHWRVWQLCPGFWAAKPGSLKKERKRNVHTSTAS